MEFDERGDFLDFQQHRNCEQKIRELANADQGVLVVIYCHGWKNSSQSGDVVEFNAFLSKLAQNADIIRGRRVHGVYLGWRGNTVRPFIDKQEEAYKITTDEFHGPIVDGRFQRASSWAGFLPENLNYWNRKAAAENKASGLPIARAIFTYAAVTKEFGKKQDNRVFVLGHSFGALMLERSLAPAMIGALTQQWYGAESKGPPLPFDLVLLVNSAAPAIYAKEMRDFLKAHRSGLGLNHDPSQDAPVIISLTSTADWATGRAHPIANLASPLSPSLKRRYTNGLFSNPDGHGYPTHSAVQQSEFYNTTPGHNRYLINHWIVKDCEAPPAADTSHEAALRSNLDRNQPHPEEFVTSVGAAGPATRWEITSKAPEGQEVTLNQLPLAKLPLAMRDSNYWIMNCGKDIISGHNDVWSDHALETYAALFRLAAVKRHPRPASPQ